RQLASLSAAVTAPSRSKSPMMTTSDVSLKALMKLLTQGRDDHRQRLRQDHESGALSKPEPQRIGGFDLAFGDRLQSAADHLGEISRSEQHKGRLSAQQLVDGHAGRQKQRQ